MSDAPDGTSDQVNESADALASVTGTQRTSSNLVDLPIVTSDVELGFEEALSVAGRRGARLIILMGETNTGKTTIITELWTYLNTQGGLSSHECAGSRTPMALEERAFHSRVASGTSPPLTPRTPLGQEGLLHMRIARPDGQRVELLFGDFAGERFTHIKDGANLLDELPWAPRADRILVVVDGERLATGSRELATNSAKRQLYALSSAEVSNPKMKLAVVVAKDDRLPDGEFDKSIARLDDLVALAQTMDADASLIRVSARPGNGADPWGLDQLLEWLCLAQPVDLGPAVSTTIPKRAIGLFGRHRD